MGLTTANTKVQQAQDQTQTHWTLIIENQLTKSNQNSALLASTFREAYLAVRGLL